MTVFFFWQLCNLEFSALRPLSALVAECSSRKITAIGKPMPVVHSFQTLSWSLWVTWYVRLGGRNEKHGTLFWTCRRLARLGTLLVTYSSLTTYRRGETSYNQMLPKDDRFVGRRRATPRRYGDCFIDENQSTSRCQIRSLILYHGGHLVLALIYFHPPEFEYNL